jgi:hypothetical protein
VEIVLAILGGGVGTALVGGIFGLVQWRLNRKAAQEDRTAAANTAVCAARGLEIQELKKMMGVLIEADRTVLYDRIKHLGKSYIARGYITVEELEDIDQMHTVYHDKDKLAGNGFLDDLMSKVRTLDVRAA